MKSAILCTGIVFVSPLFQFTEARFQFSRANQEKGINNENINVFVGYKDEISRQKFMDKNITTIRSRFKTAKAISAVIKQSDLANLQSDPDVDYVEVNPTVYSMEYIDIQTYGLQTIDALTLQTTAAKTNFSTACSDRDSFKIGVSLRLSKNECLVDECF
jgi:hypothetical protein